MGIGIVKNKGEHQRTGMGRTLVRSTRQLPNFIAALGLVALVYPFLVEHIYQNYFLGAGTFLLFLAWTVANLIQGRFAKGSPEWEQKRKGLVVMGLCLTLGLFSLTYYEMKMPKYNVAIIGKALHPVPAHLNKKQLLEMGAECNTYGNTACSHDVFARVVKKDPRDFAALANLAIAQSHLGYHREAIINFQRALTSGVSTYDAYRFYGQSLEAIGDNMAALRAFQKSLKLNPKQKALLEKIESLKSGF